MLPGFKFYFGEAIARVPSKLLHEPHDLVPPIFQEGVYPVGGENLERHDAAEVAPVVAVGGNGDGGVVVPYILAGEEVRAVGQDDVVLGEAFLHRERRRNDDDKTGAEPEGENRAIFL